MPRVTVVSPCYNEEANVEELFQRVDAVFANLPGYEFDYIFIDNASKDRTVEVLKAMAKNDQRVKIIVNSRNFGHIRSPYHGLLQGTGDAVIYLASVLQDPPELIPEFIKKWEEGYKVVWAVKTQSHETPLMFLTRKLYYEMISKLSEIELVKNATGFGLYDQRVIEILREIDDPYPYARGLISEIGFDIAKIPFTQPRRKRGITKNNFYTLYDIAMLGITNHSKVPLRLATMAGFTLAFLSLMVALGYLVAKLMFWYTFTLGMAPLIISIFFFSSVQLFFIGILGEYIGSIYTQVLKRPLVVEKERINF